MKLLTIAVLAVAITASVQPFVAESSTVQDWQQRRLLEPTPQEYAAEQKGKVIIYDGLHETMVDKALDRQFNRIGAMMFVEVQHTDANGEVWVDNGCD